MLAAYVLQTVTRKQDQVRLCRKKYARISTHADTLRNVRAHTHTYTYMHTHWSTHSRMYTLLQCSQKCKVAVFAEIIGCSENTAIF